MPMRQRLIILVMVLGLGVLAAYFLVVPVVREQFFADEEAPAEGETGQVAVVSALDTIVLAHPHFLELERLTIFCWEEETLSCPPLGRLDPYAPF